MLIRSAHDEFYNSLLDVRAVIVVLDPLVYTKP